VWGFQKGYVGVAERDWAGSVAYKLGGTTIVRQRERTAVGATERQCGSGKDSGGGHRIIHGLSYAAVVLRWHLFRNTFGYLRVCMVVMDDDGDSLNCPHHHRKNSADHPMVSTGRRQKIVVVKSWITPRRRRRCQTPMTSAEIIGVCCVQIHAADFRMFTVEAAEWLSMIAIILRSVHCRGLCIDTHFDIFKSISRFGFGGDLLCYCMQDTETPTTEAFGHCATSTHDNWAKVRTKATFGICLL